MTASEFPLPDPLCAASSLTIAWGIDMTVGEFPPPDPLPRCQLADIRLGD